MFAFSGISTFNNVFFTYEGSAIYSRHVFFENWLNIVARNAIRVVREGGNLLLSGTVY